MPNVISRQKCLYTSCLNSFGPPVLRCTACKNGLFCSPMSSEQNQASILQPSVSEISILNEDRYMLPHPRIMSQTIELETLVLNLDTGTYYSLENVASLIWQRALLGESYAEIVAAISAIWPEAATIEIGVAQLVRDLLREGLLQVSDGSPRQSANLIDADTSHHSQAYVEPRMTRYTDLQQLLLADPIHELTDAQ